MRTKRGEGRGIWLLIPPSSPGRGGGRGSCQWLFCVLGCSVRRGTSTKYRSHPLLTPIPLKGKTSSTQARRKKTEEDCFKKRSRCAENWIPGKWRNVCRISDDKVLSEKKPTKYLLMRLGRINVCNLIQHPLYYIFYLQGENIFTRTSLATKKVKVWSLFLNWIGILVLWQLPKLWEKSLKVPSFHLLCWKKKKEKPADEKKLPIPLPLYTYPWEGGNERAGKKANYFAMIWGKTVLFWRVSCTFGRNRLTFGSLSSSATIFQVIVKKISQLENLKLE